MPRVIPPVPDADDEPFWRGVAEGRLLLQRCADCLAMRHPPSPMCRHCHSVRSEWFEASGRGTVYSWIQSKHPTELDDAPRIVALIDLEEGARMVSNLQGVELDDVRPGMLVEVVFMEIDGTVLPQFRPIGTSTVVNEG
ncbi:MAG TPA: Zn-ribbon domain-containing OB-fold protein [Acidimicrobiales bacterium]